MEAKELLKNEKVELILSPHPLSFVKEQSLCLFLIIWGIVFGWLVNFSSFNGLFENNYVAIASWAIVLLLFGVSISFITIKWTTFFLYLIVVCVGVIIVLTQNWESASRAFIPIYSVIVSIIGFLFVDAYRRTHKYVITNNRIRLKGGIFTKRERTLSSDKILDLTARQGILGQIFDFGTITPITQHEFIPKGEKLLKLEGMKSKKKKAKQKDKDDADERDQLQMPEQKSYYELHGVYPYKEVKKFVEEWLQGTPEPIKPLTTYQKEQHEFLEQQRKLQKTLMPEKVDIQREMKKLPATQAKKPKKQPVAAAEQEEEEEKDEEEAPQSEQLDIQKEMKELLKKQGETKEENVEEEKDEEETETEEKS